MWRDGVRRDNVEKHLRDTSVCVNDQQHFLKRMNSKEKQEKDSMRAYICRNARKKNCN
jgi:hypothetical protein